MPGEIALRCNFATLHDSGRQLTVVDRRAGRISAETRELVEALREIPFGDGFTASIRPASGHRAVMRLAGPAPLPEISNTDPGAEDCPVLASYSQEKDNAAGEQAANEINRFIRAAYERLRDHPVNRARREQQKPPANGIITRGAGTIGSMHNIINHLGLRACVVAGELTLAGLADLFNFTSIHQSQFTALPDTGLAAKTTAALAALDDHDIVFLHIKAPDILAHDRDPVGKKEFIEHIDAALVLLFREGIVIGITANNTTDSNTGRHCGDPVPALVYSAGGRRDHCSEFGEIHCQQGGLGRISGSAFLLTMLDEMQCLQNYRTTDSAYFI
jgi:2,3-bisphosphoglycerate-independent phosphoglycerate mutase